MSMHTPGPWRICGETENGKVFGVYSGMPTTDLLTGKTHYSNCEQVLPFYDCDLKQGKNGARHLADARLIASAPELLQALHNCITAEGSHAISSQDVDRLLRRLREIDRIAREAIAKSIQD